MGVVSALLKFSGVEFDYTDWWNNHLSEVLSLVAYIALIIYFVFAKGQQEGHTVNFFDARRIGAGIITT